MPSQGPLIGTDDMTGEWNPCPISFSIFLPFLFFLISTDKALGSAHIALCHNSHASLDCISPIT
ncbi:hypothetical protein LX36DRAFT_95970 [Colletotrichum falcatum]|nr:hypothetical protein LX36DRAFT_95970 [Colletotrichum falcatum]